MTEYLSPRLKPPRRRQGMPCADRDLGILRILAREGNLGKRDPEQLYEELRRTGWTVVDFLITRQVLSDDDPALPEAIGEQTRLPTVDFSPSDIDREFALQVPEAFARFYRVLFLLSCNCVLCEDPLLLPFDSLTLMTLRHPAPVLATRAWMWDAFRHVYGGTAPLPRRYAQPRVDASWRRNGGETLGFWSETPANIDAELIRQAARLRAAASPSNTPTVKLRVIKGGRDDDEE